MAASPLEPPNFVNVLPRPCSQGKPRCQSQEGWDWGMMGATLLWKWSVAHWLKAISESFWLHMLVLSLLKCPRTLFEVLFSPGQQWFNEDDIVVDFEVQFNPLINEKQRDFYLTLPLQPRSSLMQHLVSEWPLKLLHPHLMTKYDHFGC